VATYNTAVLQGAQECHQRWIVSPAPVCGGRRPESVGVGEHFCLTLEIDFSVDVGCINGDVTEPRPDGVDVDPGAQQMRSCRMSDGVRADGSVQE